MDTTYYTFQTRKIKASGGAELVTFIPSPQPAPQADDAHTGEVLNFDLCRRRLETRAAWKDLAAAAQNAPEPEEEAEVEAQPIPYRPTPRRENRTRARARFRTPWVDILTSALALALVCLVGAAALLSIV